ncbi:DMT family transporter [Crocosphaera sp.]|uniref:DMT family transporter n=1 Tax=Crocosphaera sp. TaxID=2729996 RepID=UPI00261891BE|nr:DMT family transporter [Crocosphaera sp.]MDJ0578530.1 DMT family transporter [Crocosphaera sp.]
MRSPQIWQVILILTIGILSVSSTAIFIRLALQASGKVGLEFSLFLAASRLIIASLVLLPAWRNVVKHKVTIKAYYYAIGSGFSLALHFVCWITSLSFTSIAASTTLVTTNPIWVALLSWFLFKEKLKKVTILGIIIALLGGIFIALGGSDINNLYSQPMLGNILALMGAFFVSFYLIFGKISQQEGLKISSYSVIVYTTAAMLLFPLPFIFGDGYTNYPNYVYFYVLLMAIFSQLIGHTSINWSVRWLSPTLVTLGILFEPIGASFLGFILFQEMPSMLVLIGAVIILIGVIIAVISSQVE